MATVPAPPFVSVEEYLDSEYEPDREYVDGALVERNVGKRKHSRLQTLVARLLSQYESDYDILVYVEQRVRVSPTRFRIPDVCVMPAGHRREEVFTEPPLWVFEIVSPKDSFHALIAKAKEYLSAGVQGVCIIDPYGRTAFRADGGIPVHEVSATNLELPLVTGREPIRLPLDEWFRQLD